MPRGMLWGTHFGGTSEVPGGETWGVTFGGLPGVGTTGDVVGGDLGGSTEGRRLRAPGGKRGRFAAPPSDVYLDGWRDLIRDP